MKFNSIGQEVSEKSFESVDRRQINYLKQGQ